MKLFKCKCHRCCMGCLDSEISADNEGAAALEFIEGMTSACDEIHYSDVDVEEVRNESHG